jgi:protein O-mannosyl-transferase
MIPAEEDGLQQENEHVDSTAARTPTPWWRIAIGIVILIALAYPIARRMMASGEPPSAVTAAPATAQSILNASFQAYQAGRYQDAINAARQALQMDPNSADAYNNMAVSYLGLRMYDDAIQNAQQALRIRPDYQLAKNNLNWIVSEKAKNGGGTPPAPAANTPEYFLNQSLAHYQAHRNQECIDAARQALKLRPDYADAYNNIAAAYASMGRWDDAIQNAQQALRIRPDYQLAKNNLAWAESEKKKRGK